MDSVSIKKPDETIEEYISNLNYATSINVGDIVKSKSSSRISCGKILFSVIRTFFTVYFIEGKIFQGVEGILIARLAAIHALVAKAKIWEFNMRQKEGEGLLPPINQKEVSALKQKYYV
ncbi:MAG: hypothetical protein HZB59_00395 [Ignavibacteriales bacterium]|nr:hypothetical protein [Ignavibacteriales bacterium]